MRADKRLGQHFLRDIETLEEIAAIADIGRSAGALEIGPGEGALTAFLVRSGRPIVALERDPRAVLAVQERLGSQVEVIEGDALEADFSSLLPPPVDGLDAPVIVGNLPYNIGTAIYRRILALRQQSSRAVLMLQLEVAERIVAQRSTRPYGPLAALTELTSRAWIVRVVPPGSFRPPPKVDSAVLLVEPLAEPLLAPEEVEGFMKVAFSLFRLRRKTLIHSEIPAEALTAVGLDLKSRPEDVPAETILRLYREFPLGNG
jgi:16S rRNA (adenine1518-N6/adenine1519-N6)-dimethyltransferase